MGLRNRCNLQRKALHAPRIVLLFFPVPPSLRQAAGPLTENLPNVLTGDLRRVDLSLERPSPRGIQRRLSSRSIATAPWVSSVAVVGIKLVLARFERQRGHLAEAAKSRNSWL